GLNEFVLPANVVQTLYDTDPPATDDGGSSSSDGSTDNGSTDGSTDNGSSDGVTGTDGPTTASGTGTDEGTDADVGLDEVGSGGGDQGCNCATGRDDRGLPAAALWFLGLAALAPRRRRAHGGGR
ncbi:MAG: MYXO-CTERM sorting domain-containing protein, partial [Myxococcales bacterium]|nr:MYXO-CTERM sorting domain-containing protein [Myxococcales bacterium]